ncbi:hypothetical protein WMY93_021996 [Mugilogobius chulae]|uniref:Uncharacterized protein n=1 Tax=Mugilogobius chulae TaxID=88201 RepID=A0AAW0NHY4_9GOBI
MGNYPNNNVQIGLCEVAVNTGKRSKHNPESEHPHSNIKNQGDLKSTFSPTSQRSMQTTFALRRQEIVTGDKPVKDLLTRWPALHMESQVFAEFHRITNVNLRNTFYAELDRHTQTLIGLYRQKASRTGKISEALQKILREYDLQEQDVILKRTLSLRALSVYLKEEDSDFYLTCNKDGYRDRNKDREKERWIERKKDG